MGSEFDGIDGCIVARAPLGEKTESGNPESYGRVQYIR
jgi:hypothetical protein